MNKLCRKVVQFKPEKTAIIKWKRRDHLDQWFAVPINFFWIQKKERAILRIRKALIYHVHIVINKKNITSTKIHTSKAKQEYNGSSGL